MSVEKSYAKNKKTCTVTFELPKEAVKNVKKVQLVGEFNNWDIDAPLMKKQKSGTYTISLELNAGKEYQYRYLLDGKIWENDWKADKYVPSVFGGDNSVLVV